MSRWACASISLIILTVSVRAQEAENPDVRIFRGINNLQNPSTDGFFEYLDHTSLPTFGAIPVGFAVLWAPAIGYGRIFLGVHYPTDVLGGAVIGVVSGFAAWSLRNEAGEIAARAIAEQRIGEAGVPRAELVRIQIPL